MAESDEVCKKLREKAKDRAANQILELEKEKNDVDKKAFKERALVDMQMEKHARSTNWTQKAACKRKAVIHTEKYHTLIKYSNLLSEQLIELKGTLGII